MSISEISSAILGVATLAASLLSQVALWQQKEYRLDRLRAYLQSSEGRLTNLPFLTAALAGVFLGWLVYIRPFSASLPTLLREVLGWAALLFFTSHHVWRISRRGIFRPKFTLKASLITILSALGIAVYLFFTLKGVELLALQWATAVFFLPAIVALSVGVGNTIFAAGKRRLIARAQRLRQARTNLTVIGITGSFGKTSTKHFLEHIGKAAGKNVVATHAHHNTPLGVAGDILQQLKENVEIYIAELAAYRRGEIRDLTKIVQPHVGLLTAIGNQHLDLFGSKENILKGKWELVEALPSTGTVVLNADDPLLMKQVQGESRAVIRYSTKRRADVWLEHVHFQPLATTCTLHLRDFTQAITLPLASEALLSSAVAAAAAALALNLPPQKIAEALSSLQPFPRTMAIEKGKNGAIVIDDSYSANEQGTLIAIRHLGRFKEPDKRVVLLPLIELGSEAGAVHRRIGEAVRAVGASLYVAGNTYRKELGTGIYETDPKKLARLASANLSDTSVVLLENRLPDVVRKAILA